MVPVVLVETVNLDSLQETLAKLGLSITSPIGIGIQLNSWLVARRLLQQLTFMNVGRLLLAVGDKSSTDKEHSSIDLDLVIGLRIFFIGYLRVSSFVFPLF